MKKIVQLLTLSVVSVFLLNSCDNKLESDVFDASASERITQSITEYHKLLTSSANGWAFEYYPGGKQREAIGHIYTLHFTDTHVTAMLDIGGAVSSPTTYSLKPNGGVTLSFDEYNPLLHYFAQPSAGAYNGQLADFEFVVISHTDNEIVLKGKKYHSLMRMQKLQETAETYMAKVRAVRDFVMGKGFSTLLVNNKEVSFKQSGNFIFTYQENQQDVKISTTFVFTDKGIRFYEPLTIDGVTFQELTLNTQDNALSSADGKVVFKLLYEFPFDFSSASIWRVDASNSSLTSDAFREVFNNVKQINDQRYANLNVSLSTTIIFKGDTEEIELFSTIIGSNRGYAARYKMAFRGGKNPNEVNISLVGEGHNWNFFTHLNPLRNLIAESSPYRLEMDDSANPTVVKFISIANPDVWFVLVK